MAVDAPVVATAGLGGVFPEEEDGAVSDEEDEDDEEEVEEELEEDEEEEEEVDESDELEDVDETLLLLDRLLLPSRPSPLPPPPPLFVSYPTLLLPSLRVLSSLLL